MKKNMSMNKNSIVIIILILILTSFAIWYYARSGTFTNTRDESTLIVGTNAEFPPFTFIKNEEIVGFDIDIIKEVAK